MWFLGSQTIGEPSYPFVFLPMFFTILSFFFVVGRLYTRVRISRDLGYDDYCIVAAELFQIAVQVFHLFQIALGLGNPTIIVPKVKAYPWVMPEFLGLLYASMVSYQIATVLVKVSIIFQYRRLFTTWNAQTNTFFLLCWMVLSGGGTSLLALFHCWPISNFWSTDLRGGCLSLEPVTYALTITNVVNNVIIWLFPFFYVIPLKLAGRKKRNLLILFASGLLPEGFGIGRLYSLTRFVVLDMKLQLVSKDAMMLNLMGSLEVATAIIIASVPALIPLFRLGPARYRQRVFGRAPTNPYTRNTPRTPTRSNSFARHLEGLESGESVLLQDLLRGRTPASARAMSGHVNNTTPGPPPRTPASQHTTYMESPSQFMTPTTPSTGFISDTPPRLEIRAVKTSFLSDALPGFDGLARLGVRVDRTGGVDVDDIGDMNPRDVVFGTTTTISTRSTPN